MSMNLCYTFTSGGATINYGESTEDYSVGRNSATRVVFTTWADAETFQDKVLTASSFTVSAGAWTMTFRLGWKHPFGNNLYVADDIVTPIGVPTGEGTWTYARHELRYERVDKLGEDFTANDRRVDRIETASETISIPKEVITHSGAPALVVKPFLLQMKRYTVTFLQVDDVPLSSVTACENKVNAGSFTLRVNDATETYPAGHVLFLGASIDTRSRTVSESGTYSDLSLSFLCSTIDHRKSFNARAAGTSIEDKMEAPAVTLYETADFSTLGV